jgi:hypothetical protein
LPDFAGRSPYFGKLAFRYDPAADAYICPGGSTLPFERLDKAQQLVVYRADPAACNACPLKERCTASAHGRSVSRSYDEAYVDQVRAYQETAPYKKALRKRSVWVEPLFAEAKDWHGLRRFRLRRLWRVNTEALLIAAGQNLKRLLSWRGWGRRPWPGGAPGLHLAHATLPAPRVLHVYWLVVRPLRQRIPPAMPLASGTSVRAA